MARSGGSVSPLAAWQAGVAGCPGPYSEPISNPSKRCGFQLLIAYIRDCDLVSLTSSLKDTYPRGVRLTAPSWGPRCEQVVAPLLGVLVTHVGACAEEPCCVLAAVLLSLP